MKKELLLHISCILAAVSAFFAASVPVCAVTPKDDPFEFTRHRGAFTGALVSQAAYHLEVSYHYMLNRYVGLGGGLGLWQNYFSDGYPQGPEWRLDEDSARPGNLYLRLSALLKTPSITFKSARWGLMAEPACMLQVPYTRVYVNDMYGIVEANSHRLSTNNGQWLVVELRTGIYVNFGPIGINAGYALSNLDIYSYYRNLSYNGVSFRRFYPAPNPISHGAFLTAAYYFGN